MQLIFLIGAICVFDKISEKSLVFLTKSVKNHLYF